MTAVTTSQLTTQRARRRNIAAVLAGGLVLGVGTTATLASWNDSEFAKATFTAGIFNLEGAVDASQASFSEHATALAACGTTFTAPFNNLTPTDVVVAPFAVRLAANTTNSAHVSLTATIATDTIVPNLTYELIKTATAGCTTASTGRSVVAAGTAVTSVAGAAAFDLTNGVGAAPGAPAYLCFKVTAGGLVSWAFWPRQSRKATMVAAAVLSSATVSSISAGASHACSVADSSAYCWGSGSDGRLGNRATDTVNYPVQVAGNARCASGSVAIGDGACSLAPAPPTGTESLTPWMEPPARQAPGNR